MREETVVGSEATRDSERAWIMIHRMHARALHPPAGWRPRSPTSPDAPTSRRDHEAVGWITLLEEAAQEDATELGKTLATCARCKADAAFALATRRAGERAVQRRPGLHHVVRMAVHQEGTPWRPQPGPPLAYQPAFAWGPVIREIFAGKKVVTRAAEAHGIRVLPPVELYDDPDT